MAMNRVQYQHGLVGEAGAHGRYRSRTLKLGNVPRLLETTTIKTTRTTPLRLRMIDAMVLRGFAERTQGAYVAAVRLLAEHHHRSPDLLSDEQVQGYLLHLLQTRHLSRSTVNQAACAARFLYCEVLGQVERRPQIPLGKRGQRLPEVLSRAEVAALLDACISCKALTP